MKWKVTVNGTVHSEIEGYGGEWQYLLLNDVPLTEESNTVHVGTSTRNFLSLDYVEVLTLDATDANPKSHTSKRSNVPENHGIRVVDGGVVVSLARSGMTTVDIMDLAGRHVARPVRRNMSAGTYRLALPEDARLGGGRVYIVRLKAGDAVRSRMVIVAGR